MTTKEVKDTKDLGVVEFIYYIDTCNFCGKEAKYNKGSSPSMRKCKICGRHVCEDCYKKTDACIESKTQYLYCEMCCKLGKKWMKQIEDANIKLEEKLKELDKEEQRIETEANMRVKHLYEEWKNEALSLVSDNEN